MQPDAKQSTQSADDSCKQENILTFFFLQKADTGDSFLI